MRSPPFSNGKLHKQESYNSEEDSDWDFIERIKPDEQPTKLMSLTNKPYCTEQYNNCDIPLNHLVLWRHPYLTFKYFFSEVLIAHKKAFKKIKKHRVKVTIMILLSLIIFTLLVTPGIHNKKFVKSKQKIMWCIYWVGLGILSSVGLGTGLHTFVLYLGPHIASVTIAAYECNSLKFPEPPYPNEIICPLTESVLSSNGLVSLLAIMKKVYLEAFMWGAGTALGELPPYFMARAARTSDTHPLDENYEAFEQLLQKSQSQIGQLSWMNRAKLFMQNLVQNVGFSGILLCASIPNPLFDFAGITCGHFNVPFWTFFGATFIGKAIIKVNIQELFVIIAFSEHHVDRLVAWMKYVPMIGPYLQAPFKEYLNAQKVKLHSRKQHLKANPTWLSWAFEKVLLVTIIYFIVSIIHSMAQKHRIRLEHKHLKSQQRNNNVLCCLLSKSATSSTITSNEYDEDSSKKIE